MGKSSKPKMEVTYFYMSIHFGICVSADAMTRVIIKEKVAWDGDITELTAVPIEEDELFGGAKKEGGAEGTIYFLPGASDQILPDILARRLLPGATGTDVPGYRGICTAFFTGEGTEHGAGGGGSTLSKLSASDKMPGFYWSANTPYLPGVWIEVRRRSIGLNPLIAFIGELTFSTQAFYFAIGKCAEFISGMEPATFEAMKAATVEALEVMKTAVGIVPVHVAVGLYGTSAEDLAKYDATEEDIDDLIAWVEARTQNGVNTDLGDITDRVQNFIATSGVDGSANKHLFWLAGSDGIDVGGRAVDYITDNPDGISSWMFEVDDDTGGENANVDNTASDGVPHLFSDDLSAYVAAVTEALNPEVEGRLDANPAHIIYECLTNTDWGMGSPSSAIDVDSFEAAAATLYDESFGLSMIWTRQSSIQKFVQEVLDHIQAVLFVDRETGLLTLKLIRADYDVEDLPILDPSNSVISSFGRKAWGEIVNEIVVTWTNPENEQDETVTAQDLASITIQGGIISDGRNYYGVRNAPLARRLAQRDLRQSGAPLAACEMEVNRELWFLRPASVVKVDWPEDGFDNIVMRVTSINYGRPGDMMIKLSLLEDVFGLDAGDYEEPPTTGWEDPSAAPAPMEEDLIFTLPLYFAANTTVSAFVDSPEYPEVLAGVLSSTSGDDTQAVELWDEITLPDGSLEWQLLSELNVIGRAELADAVDAEIETIIDTIDNFTGNTGPTQGGFVIIGDDDEETVEIALITDVGEDITVSRGVLDTVPRVWPAGSPVWFVNADTSLEDPLVRSAGEEVSYKLRTRTSQGLLPLGSAPLISYTLTERPWLPNRPANVIAHGVGFNTVDTPVDATERTDPWVETSWANRNRLLEDAQVLDWDDATVDPEDGQTTRIDVLTADLSSVLTVHDELPGTSFDVPDASFVGETIVALRFSSDRTDDDGTFASLQSHVIWVQVAPLRLTEGSDARMTEEGDRRALED